MGSRFEQAIAAGVLAGAIALGGCASSGGGGNGNPEEPDTTAPELQAAIAHLYLPRELADKVVLTFSEDVQLTDAEAAAGAFVLAENMSRVMFGESGTFYVSPFYACLSVTPSNQWVANIDCTSDGRPSSTMASNLPHAASVSPSDATKLILDYSAVGLNFNAGHGTGYLRLRYTDPGSHPVQDLAGNALEDIDFPPHSDPGNVVYDTSD